MNPHFDLYPNYLRSFETSFDPQKAFKLQFDIQAMRSYKMIKNDSGKWINTPQVRKEGSLSIHRPDAANGVLKVEQRRFWSTWLDQEPATEQIFKALVSYNQDTIGSLKQWEMTYTTTPILPVKSFKFNALAPLRKAGRVEGNRMITEGVNGALPHEQILDTSLSSLYSLIERIPVIRPERCQLEVLDDLTMRRPGLSLRPVGTETVDVEGQATNLQGWALLGPAMMPMTFWLDDHNRIIAIIGRNLAYTLVSATNI